MEYKQTSEAATSRKQIGYQSRFQPRTNENQPQQRTRIFKSRNFKNTNHGPAQLDFTTPNRFSLLNAGQFDSETINSPTGNRKQKASSPLENQQNVKKPRENMTENAPHQSPQEPMDTHNPIAQRPTLQQLATVVTQEPNSQHVSRDNSPVRNADASVSL